MQPSNHIHNLGAPALPYFTQDRESKRRLVSDILYKSSIHEVAALERHEAAKNAARLLKAQEAEKKRAEKAERKRAEKAARSHRYTYTHDVKTLDDNASVMTGHSYSSFRHLLPRIKSHDKTRR